LGVTTAERAALYRAHIAESWGTDETTETERIARRALDAYAELDDDAGVGWANARLTLPLFMQGRHDEAEEAARIAVRTLEPLGEDEALADALHLLGWFLWRRGREEEAEPLLRRSVEIAARVDARLVHAEATQTLAMCLGSFGRTVEAHQLMVEAFRLAKEVGYFANLMRAYNNIANAFSQDDLADAEAVLREGLELALRAGARSNAAWIMGSLGDTVFRLGRLAETYDA
jgi:tetratricopeptide (TPR) repeat protein